MIWYNELKHCLVSAHHDSSLGCILDSFSTFAITRKSTSARLNCGLTCKTDVGKGLEHAQQRKGKSFSQSYSMRPLLILRKRQHNLHIMLDEESRVRKTIHLFINSSIHLFIKLINSILLRLEIFSSLFYTECGISHFLFCHCLRGMKLSSSRQEALNSSLEML